MGLFNKIPDVTTLVTEFDQFIKKAEAAFNYHTAEAKAHDDEIRLRTVLKEAEQDSAAKAQKIANKFKEFFNG